jgi:hypothetical protein
MARPQFEDFGQRDPRDPRGRVFGESIHETEGFSAALLGEEDGAVAMHLGPPRWRRWWRWWRWCPRPQRSSPRAYRDISRRLMDVGHLIWIGVFDQRASLRLLCRDSGVFHCRSIVRAALSTNHTSLGISSFSKDISSFQRGKMTDTAHQEEHTSKNIRLFLV